MRTLEFWGDSIYQALSASPTSLRPDKRAQSLVGTANYQLADLPDPEVFTSEGIPHFFLIAGAYIARVRDHEGSTLIDLGAGKATKIGLLDGDWFATPEETYYVGSASSDSSENEQYDITLDLPEYYDVQIRALCVDRGWDTTTPATVTVTVAAGTEIGQVSATAALRTGSFPAGSVVTLVNNGKISGYGGTGGEGAIAGGASATAGSAGGDAFKAVSAISVDNQGTLRGGGGGGGGGGTDGVDDGGDGGGGQGQPGGLADGGDVDQRGTIATPGPAAVAAGGAGDGGAGGAWGTAGTAGETVGPSTGGAAGAAGNSVVGDSYVTWIETGTRTGPVT